MRGRAVYSFQFLSCLFSFREEHETKRYPYFMKEPTTRFSKKDRAQ